MSFRVGAALIVVVLIVVVLAGIAAFVWLRPGEQPADVQTAAKPERPTLYCEFYNFTHNATVVAFDFAVSRDTGASLEFSQLFVVEPDGTKTTYEPDAPRWIYDKEDETPVLTSPDSATRIMLYGLKPNVGGVFWTEAGIRSNTYRNLEGKCRQAHLGSVAKAR